MIKWIKSFFGMNEPAVPEWQPKQAPAPVEEATVAVPEEVAVVAAETPKPAKKAAPKKKVAPKKKTAPKKAVPKKKGAPKKAGRPKKTAE